MIRDFTRKMVLRLGLPLAARWVEAQEKRILAEGVPLSETEKQWAAKVGVREVDRVRLLYVSVVPLPGSPLINRISDLLRYPLAPVGLAARYGIFLQSNSRNDPSLLVHELVHVAQYERLGSVRAFLHQYLEQCLSSGYWNAAMEDEARNAAIPFNRPPDR